MKTLEKKLQLQKILLEEIISGKIDLLLEQTSTNPEDAKKAGEVTVETQEIAPQINDLVSKIKTADANLKKSQNDFVNAANNVLNRVKSSDGLTDPQIVANNISSIENKLVSTLTQNKTVSYKNLATRDNTMLAIINLLNAEYERLTGKKLPTFNVNKILPGLMAARAAGISVPSAPSQPTTSARGSIGTSAGTSSTGTSGTIRAEHKEIVKEIVSLLLEEVEIEELPENFDFEFFKKKLKSKSWNTKWEGLKHARDNLTELGQGSSRIAFLLPDEERVLKVAKNEAGIAQNKQELKILLNPSIAKIYTEIYEWDKGKTWIITEYVKPFRNPNEFARQIGVPNNTYETLLKDMQKWLGKDLEELKEIYQVILTDEEKKYQRNIKGKRLSTEQKLQIEKEFKNLKFDLESKQNGIESIVQNKQTYDFFMKIVSLLQRGLVAQDLTYNHFGKSDNGQIKLYDYGFSLDVWKKYYK